MTRLLLAADRADVRERIQRLLSGGPELVAVPCREDMWKRLARQDFDLLLVQEGLLPDPQTELLTALAALPERPGVVVLAERDAAAQRARLLAAGCRAVLWLGLEDDSLAATLTSLARRASDGVRERLSAVRREKRSTLDEFVATSASMRRFVRMAKRLVRSESPLLILGETGVGKERLARSMHSESARSTGPFVTLNCGALPESLLESELFGHEEGAFTGATRARRGYFELAHRGTLFLDEIGELPLHLQVKLLRVLEERSVRRVGSEKSIDVDVRVIAATNRNLERERDEGRFRADLYYRLAVVSLTVPPLRERREDVPELARGFLERACRQLGRPVVGFHPEALDALARRPWPGNVRELINVVERAVLLTPGSEIGVEDLVAGETWDEPDGTEDSAPSAVASSLPLAEARAQVVSRFERAYLSALLAETEGRIGETARRAGVNERTLYAMMRRHGLRKEDFKASGQSRGRTS